MLNEIYKNESILVQNKRNTGIPSSSGFGNTLREQSLNNSSAKASKRYTYENSSFYGQDVDYDQIINPIPKKVEFGVQPQEYY